MPSNPIDAYPLPIPLRLFSLYSSLVKLASIFVNQAIFPSKHWRDGYKHLLGAIDIESHFIKLDAQIRNPHGIGRSKRFRVGAGEHLHELLQ